MSDFEFVPTQKQIQESNIYRFMQKHHVSSLTEPQILHYGEPEKGDMLPVGTSFTIEPMINLGDWRCQVLDDDWTAVTVDGKLSAQFEHTMVVTETGVEIFTLGAQETNPLLKNV